MYSDQTGTVRNWEARFPSALSIQRQKVECKKKKNLASKNTATLTQSSLAYKPCEWTGESSAPGGEKSWGPWVTDNCNFRSAMQQVCVLQGFVQSQDSNPHPILLAHLSPVPRPHWPPCIHPLIQSLSLHLLLLIPSWPYEVPADRQVAVVLKRY